LRIVRSRAEAEDVVQDTFVEVWRRAREYDGARGEISAWIMGMARSRCIDRLRRARVRANYAARGEHHDVVTQAVDERVIESEHGARVHAALAKLPREQQTALSLAYFEGLTQQQVAEKLALPLGTVKTRIRLALEKLAKELEP
jgi:RNA polymerase sigma-70 factor, ECF subfamily